MVRFFGRPVSRPDLGAFQPMRKFLVSVRSVFSLFVLCMAGGVILAWYTSRPARIAHSQVRAGMSASEVLRPGPWSGALAKNDLTEGQGHKVILIGISQQQDLFAVDADSSGSRVQMTGYQLDQAL